MTQDPPKLSSGPSDSEGSFDSSDSIDSSVDSSGSVDSGSVDSGSVDSGSTDSTDSGSGDSGSNDSGSSVGSSSNSGSSGGGSGASDDKPIEYQVIGVIVVTYSPGWSVVWMMEAAKTGASLVHENGDSSGGLTCEWPPFPDPNNLQSIISGGYTTAESFVFRFMESEPEHLVAARNLAVENTGENDIRVQTDGGLIDVVVAPGDTCYLADHESISAPWGESSFLFSVAAA